MVSYWLNDCLIIYIKKKIFESIDKNEIFLMFSRNGSKCELYKKNFNLWSIF
jgi:hypothetical protein